MFRRIHRLAMEPTSAIPGANYRAFVAFNVGAMAAIGVHLCLLPLFWWLGAVEMLWANIPSLGAYVLALLANRRGWHAVTMALATIELAVHQALCVYFLGGQAGFQFYLLLVPAVVFFLPPGRLLTEVSLAALASGTFLVLQTWSLHNEAVYAVDPGVLTTIRLFNIGATCALLGFFAMNYSRAATIAEAKLAEEHAKAEALLHNILPAPVAARLKTTPGVIADRFEMASVLFCDIVGFTPMSESMGAEALVGMLDDVFSEFDDLTTAHGLEKIKTIGDAYMVAAGIPEPRPDHAVAIARLALDMQAVMARRRAVNGSDLRIRIGIHSGPVVAGVIGKSKFAYDLWGDSVNTAARMEAHGVPGRIQVSEAVREALGASFVFEERGLIDVKGKGAMRTWLLLGPVQGVPV